MQDNITNMKEAAIKVLEEEYDENNDSFFLVYTKKGKLPIDDQAQTCIGEMPLRPTLFFIIRVLRNLAHFNNEHPFVYIVRHIMRPFMEAEQLQMDALKEQANTQDLVRQEAVRDINTDSTRFGNTVVIMPDFNIEN